MRKLGQHFLKNTSALQLIASSLEIAPGDIVIEIGPGHGELTEFIIAGKPKKIILIEKDSSLQLLLEKKFKDDARIDVIGGDALKELPAITSRVEFMPHGFKVVGNIPYYITGHLLRILSELTTKPDKCVFTIQKEVAERICAKPPHMNRLAASVQFWSDAKIIKTLPAGDFNPPPKVASAIISLKTNIFKGNSEKYYAAVRGLFAQPRKMIGNNLVKATRQPAEIVAERLALIHIAASSRPQDLGTKDIVSIAELFF